MHTFVLVLYVYIHLGQTLQTAAPLLVGDGGGVACFGDSVCDLTMGVIGAWQDYSAGLSCLWQLWAPLWLALWCSGAAQKTAHSVLSSPSLQWNRTTTDHHIFGCVAKEAS